MDNITPPMVKAETRGLIAKTIIEVLRGFTVVNFGSQRLGELIEENLIAAAIVIGQAEGRLLSASDIAAYIGLPRATVVRKLRRVAMLRMLGKAKDGNRVVYFIKDPNDEKVVGEIQKIMATIRQCCDRLSKMDTLNLDRKTGTY